MTMTVFMINRWRRISLVLLLSLLLLNIIISLVIFGNNGGTLKKYNRILFARTKTYNYQEDIGLHNKTAFRKEEPSSSQACGNRSNTRLEVAEGPRSDTANRLAPNKHSGFQAERVLKLFFACRGEGNIFINYYVDAYEELCKLFRLFGTIFGFVTSNVENKIRILRDYHNGEHSKCYKTVQGMLEFEVRHNLTDNKKQPSGAQTLLDLHRAVKFISAFLLKLKETDNTVKFSSSASEAYDSTLAKHHLWLTRQAVHVAFYMLPSRQEILKKMEVEDSEKGMQGLSDLISELNIIFDIIEKLYTKYDLLDLP